MRKTNIDSFLIFLVQADINQILITQITITPQLFQDSSSPLNPIPPIQYPSPPPARTPLLYDFDASITTLYPPIAPHFTNCQPPPASVRDYSSLIQVHTIPPLADSSTSLIAATISSITPPPRWVFPSVAESDSLIPKGQAYRYSYSISHPRCPSSKWFAPRWRWQYLCELIHLLRENCIPQLQFLPQHSKELRVANHLIRNYYLMMLLFLPFEEILLHVFSTKTFHVPPEERCKLLFAGEGVWVVGAGLFGDGMFAGLSEMAAICFLGLLHHNFIIYCIGTQVYNVTVATYKKDIVHQLFCKG